MVRFIVWFSLLAFVPEGGQDLPYLDFNKAGAGFYGDGRSLPEPAGLTSVRIGILGPAKTREGLHQRVAIQIALDEANHRGGYKPRLPNGNTGSESAHDNSCSTGIPYEGVFREDDGPWGIAAKQVVRLAYEDKVWAIIGGLDGLHTHVAELVVAKAWVPVISPSAVDSTISYANVPWVFRTAPTDSRQADALLGLAESRGYRNPIILTELDREAHSGWLRLRESAARRRFSIGLHLEFAGTSPEEIIPRLTSIRRDSIIIWGKTEPALRLLLLLRAAGISEPVLGSSDLASAEVAENAAFIGDLTVAGLCDPSPTDDAFAIFAREFSSRTGQAPSATAIYSYDVARLTLAAIQKAGLNRALIRDRLSETAFSGLSGPIRFNGLGGNDAAPVLLNLRRNRWVRLDY